jgi:hypothetical protein
LLVGPAFGRGKAEIGNPAAVLKRSNFRVFADIAEQSYFVDAL